MGQCHGSGVSRFSCDLVDICSISKSSVIRIVYDVLLLYNKESWYSYILYVDFVENLSLRSEQIIIFTFSSSSILPSPSFSLPHSSPSYSFLLLSSPSYSFLPLSSPSYSFLPPNPPSSPIYSHSLKIRHSLCLHIIVHVKVWMKC